MIDTSTLITDVVADYVFDTPSSSCMSTKLPSLFESYNVYPDSDYFLPNTGVSGLIPVVVADYFLSADRVDGQMLSTKTPISFSEYNDSDNFRIGPLLDMVGFEYVQASVSTTTPTVRQFWG